MFSTKKPSATDELIKYVLLKVKTEPCEWKLDKYGTKFEWYQYKKSSIFLGLDRLGVLQDCSGKDGIVRVSKKQSRLLTQAALNLRAKIALQSMIKASVENAV